MTLPDPSSDTAAAGTTASGRRLIWQIAAALVAVALVVAFAVAFQLVRGAGTTSGNANASGPTTPATALLAPTATPIPTATATPSPTPTATPVPKHADLRITQNQDVRPGCLDTPTAYTVKLVNSGNVTVNWRVEFPISGGLPPAANGSLSGYPSWGNATPGSGSLTAGQSSSFQIIPMSGIPCGGKVDSATLKLSFPQGGSQPDIPLTYAGTGPAPFANIVVLQNQNYTESCPGGVAPPPPYTVTIQNTGNSTAYFSLYTTQTFQNKYWVNATITSLQSQVQPGQTMQISMAPESWIACNGTVYKLEILANGPQGTQDVTLTDTVN